MAVLLYLSFTTAAWWHTFSESTAGLLFCARLWANLKDAIPKANELTVLEASEQKRIQELIKEARAGELRKHEYEGESNHQDADDAERRITIEAERRARQDGYHSDRFAYPVQAATTWVIGALAGLAHGRGIATQIGQIGFDL